MRVRRRESADANCRVSAVASQPASYAVASLQPEIAKRRAPALDTEGESNAAVRLGRLYFGNIIGEGVGTIQPWPADEEVLIESPPAHDPDIKRSALASPSGRRFQFRDAVGAAVPACRAAPRRSRPARRSRPRAR